MGLRYVFHPSRSRHISPDRAEGRVSDMQWKGEVFFRLVGNAQKTYKIGINAASIPVDGSLARETTVFDHCGFSLSGVCFPSASRSDAMYECYHCRSTMLTHNFRAQQKRPRFGAFF